MCWHLFCFVMSRHLMNFMVCGCFMVPHWCFYVSWNLCGLLVNRNLWHFMMYWYLRYFMVWWFYMYWSLWWFMVIYRHLW